jgi:hypothetical protein
VDAFDGPCGTSDLTQNHQPCRRGCSRASGSRLAGERRLHACSAGRGPDVQAAHHPLPCPPQKTWRVDPQGSVRPC